MDSVPLLAGKEAVSLHLERIRIGRIFSHDEEEIQRLLELQMDFLLLLRAQPADALHRVVQQVPQHRAQLHVVQRASLQRIRLEGERNPLFLQDAALCRQQRVHRKVPRQGGRPGLMRAELFQVLPAFRALPLLQHA